METAYHLDIIQSAKKYDKYAEAEHYDVVLVRFPSVPRGQAIMRAFTHPHNGQCHLSYPKPPVHIPIHSCPPNDNRRPSFLPYMWANTQQFSQKRKRTTKPPPRRWENAQSPTY